LLVATRADGPTEADVRRHAAAAGLRIVSPGLSFDNVDGAREFSCEVRWRARSGEDEQSAFVGTLAQLPGVTRITWTPRGAPRS
jgi:hypothetical protein